MASLPSYLTEARPIPWENRAPWYKNVMPTYFGIFLWFVFWQNLANGGVTEGGHPAGLISPPLGGFMPVFTSLIISALICHFLFYLAPALLGMRTGLPLYVIGSSTYGARGGRYMPGFLMGILQFGWMAVNAFFVAGILCESFGLSAASPGWAHGIIATVFVVLAAVMGLKGIQYVARVATYLPLIPVAILIFLLVLTAGGLPGLGNNPQHYDRLSYFIPENSPYVDRTLGYIDSRWTIFSMVCIYVVGFFATAGAAGCDIAANCRNHNDVHVGGITGILLPIVLTGEVVLLAIGGAYGAEMVRHENYGNYNLVDIMPDIFAYRFGAAGPTVNSIAKAALAIASFPAACFSAFIAANSFKTVMPKINPWLSVGVGTAAAAALAVSGWAGQVVSVFLVIGASFGPICGAILADFWLSGRRWSGPRAGFNPAGWISWAVGFVVGAFNLVVDLMLKSKWEWAAAHFPNLAEYKDMIPIPPVTAFLVGFALYIALSAVGIRTRKLLGPDGRLLE